MSHPHPLFCISLIELCLIKTKFRKNPPPSLKYHEQFLWVELLFQGNREYREHLNRFDYLSDHKNPLFEDLFPLFGIEHQLQRFDKRLIGIDVVK